MIDPIEYLTTPRWQKVNLGLERIRALLEMLGRPQDSLRFVQVAGTNGKGSTCAFLASILQHAGLKVGLFTSPALYQFEDRIRINGVPISPENLRDTTLEVKAAVDRMMSPISICSPAEQERLEEHPTEFELLTAVAFEYFAHEKCDIVVCEVGLGGRLDSTNAIDDAEASVITPISFDHRALLGNTLVQIAGEKAGIIKRGSPVVSAPQQPEVLSVLEKAAKAQDDTLKLVDARALSGTNSCFSYRGRADLSIGLLGSFQLINAATALDTIDVLRAHGWKISEEAIRLGLARTHWPGRFEVVSEEPLVIIDGGHNIAGMQALSRVLIENYPHHARIVVSGVLADKDYSEMADELVLASSEIITVTPENTRALPASAYAEVIQQAAKKAGRTILVSAASSIGSGIHQALQRYDQLSRTTPALICVCGSLYLLGSVMEVLRPTGIAL